jgi:hypothetical protein
VKVSIGLVALTATGFGGHSVAEEVAAKLASSPVAYS